MARTRIVKNDWMAAADCLAMAWEGLRSEPQLTNEAALFRMIQGREVGDLARDLFPGGTVVFGTPSRGAAEHTKESIADPAIHTLFEAAFVAEPFSARADILTRDSNAWHVLEVKSGFSDSSRLDAYVDDLAYTSMILKRAGVDVSRASLVLLSRDFRKGMAVDSLFDIVDVTSDVQDRMHVFDVTADGIAVALLSDARPAPVLVPACRQCDYFAERCLGAGHRHTVLELPHLHRTKFQKLAESRIIGLGEVPEDFVLTERQERVRTAAATGTTLVDCEGLSSCLDTIQWPCHYLDFETVATVLPLYPDHGCHRQVLTQFSIHHRDAFDAEPHHSAFLADASRSQERELAKSLIDSLGTSGSIVVYGSFEKTRIMALCSAFPDLDLELREIIDRLVDLCAIVSSYIYHPDFKGSFSIKTVLPALVPDLSYEGLAVRDGDTAIALFGRMARGEIVGSAIGKTRQQLLEYCALDTLAMVRLHEALSGMARWRIENKFSGAPRDRHC